jgi:hypothetical protein
MDKRITLLPSMEAFAGRLKRWACRVGNAYVKDYREQKTFFMEGPSSS